MVARKFSIGGAAGTRLPAGPARGARRRGPRRAAAQRRTSKAATPSTNSPEGAGRRKDDLDRGKNDGDGNRSPQLEQNDPPRDRRGDRAAARDRLRDRPRCAPRRPGGRRGADRGALGPRRGGPPPQAARESQGRAPAAQAEPLARAGAQPQRLSARVGEVARSALRTRGGEDGEGVPCGPRRGWRGSGLRGCGFSGPPGRAFEPPSSSVSPRRPRRPATRRSGTGSTASAQRSEA